MTRLNCKNTYITENTDYVNAPEKPELCNFSRQQKTREAFRLAGFIYNFGGGGGN
jgi:hypothetical protein